MLHFLVTASECLLDEITVDLQDAFVYCAEFKENARELVLIHKHIRQFSGVFL